jgi:hypothetical protein
VLATALEIGFSLREPLQHERRRAQAAARGVGEAHPAVVSFE